MKQILILGAGKSSAHLIRHFAQNAERLNIGLCVLDLRVSHIPVDIRSNARVCISEIDASDPNPYDAFISKSDIVISMLPASLHLGVARSCLQYRKHLITPSYISESMKELHLEVAAQDLIFLNEMGFDPGIDHMTTMKIVDEIQRRGGVLTSYRSYAGGLIAPISDDNPWHYKFSWNPRNVILAGQGGDIVFRSQGQNVSYTYEQLFEKSELISINSKLQFDGYANRDSLKYESLYGWEGLDTLQRGTLRHIGFCKAWDLLIQLGLTDDTTQVTLEEGSCFFDFYSMFYKLAAGIDLRERFYKKYHCENDVELQEKFEYIGFFDLESKLKKTIGTAAQIFQSILEDKWALDPEDKDWVVMVHFISYTLHGKHYEITSSLSLEGEDAHYTAMSKTVGMPIALACELILENKISQKGVLMPIHPECYLPLLDKLESHNVRFEEVERVVNL